ncbi:MAG: hypothetical protein S4CHLAM2_03160 [Chlamydiales bacterium]|nr:hypothetical protein [Chlamydiales bacterium]
MSLLTSISNGGAAGAVAALPQSSEEKISVDRITSKELEPFKQIAQHWHVDAESRAKKLEGRLREELEACSRISKLVGRFIDAKQAPSNQGCENYLQGYEIVAARANGVVQALGIVCWEHLIKLSNSKLNTCYIYHLVTSPKNVDRSEGNVERFAGSARALVSKILYDSQYPVYIEANKEAEGFYQKLGFQVIKVDPFELGAIPMLLPKLASPRVEDDTEATKQHG